MEACRLAGMNFVAKPVNKERLLAAILTTMASAEAVPEASAA